VSDINEPDDLLGMLPDEIIAALDAARAEIQALKAEQAADVAFYRLTAQQRDQAWVENTTLRETLELIATMNNECVQAAMLAYDALEKVRAGKG
jgi:hypothetical protein